MWCERPESILVDGAQCRIDNARLSDSRVGCPGALAQPALNAAGNK